MEPRIHVVTLLVEDVAKAAAFYRDGLGWPVKLGAGASVAYVQTAGCRLALCRADTLQLPQDASHAPGLIAEDPADSPRCSRAPVLSQNVRTAEEVDFAITLASRSGASVLMQPSAAPWGGRHAFFADPQGYLWEIVWNPKARWSPDLVFESDSQ